MTIDSALMTAHRSCASLIRCVAVAVAGVPEANTSNPEAEITGSTRETWGPRPAARRWSPARFVSRPAEPPFGGLVHVHLYEPPLVHTPPPSAWLSPRPRFPSRVSFMRVFFASYCGFVRRPAACAVYVADRPRGMTPDAASERRRRWDASLPPIL